MDHIAAALRPCLTRCSLPSYHQAGKLNLKKEKKELK